MPAAMARVHDRDEHRNSGSRCQLTKHDKRRRLATHFDHSGGGGEAWGFSQIPTGGSVSCGLQGCTVSGLGQSSREQSVLCGGLIYPAALLHTSTSASHNMPLVNCCSGMACCEINNLPHEWVILWFLTAPSVRSLYTILPHRRHVVSRGEANSATWNGTPTRVGAPP
jgi:hypothetical protein